MRADDKAVKEYADNLYSDLQKAGIEVIYDDRQVSAGFMFSDADLIGVPVRVVVSPRNMKNSVIELSTRDKSIKESVPTENAVQRIKELVNELLEKCR
jgi:prolyl-tRNA synthetase